MDYQEFEPAPLLSAYIQSLWMREKDFRIPETIRPAGRSEIIIQRGAPLAKLPEAFFTGPRTRPLVLQSSGTTRLYGVRFHPWGAYPLIQRSMEELKDRTLALSELFEGFQGFQGEDPLWSLQAFVFERIAPEIYAIPPWLLILAERLLETKGPLPPQENPLTSGHSLEEIEEAFRQIIGLSPECLCETLNHEGPALAD